MTERTITDLRAVIEHAITHDPRTLQVELGPSEIGTGCDRCLAHMLAGDERHERTVPWLPTIGRAVHEWLETAVLQHLGASGTARYLPEIAATVGQLRGIDITGHADLFDIDTGTVVDYKIVGSTTLKKVKAHPGETYRNQAHLYGKGLAAAGFDVQHVAIWFLPRNGISIDHGHVFTEPYNEQVATAALARANAIAGGIDALGVDAVLDQMPPHTGAEFACTKWATDPSTAPAGEVTPDAFLGV